MKHEPMILLFKAHVDTYTRKDGTVVQAHDDKRPAAAAPYKKGDRVRIKKEHQDEGDDKFDWHAVDDEEKGRVTISPNGTGMKLPPSYVVDSHMIERHEGDVEPKPHPSGKHKVGDQVFFPHPDKPGKNALGKYAGHRGGKSVVKHGDKEIDVEHDQVKAARGVPKAADPKATSAARHEFADWGRNVKSD